MKSTLLAASIINKEAFELIKQFADFKGERMPSLIMEEIEKYYKKDPSAVSADLHVLKEQILSGFANEKHKGMAETALAEVEQKLETVSIPNIKSLLLANKIRTTKEKLAVALVNDDAKAEKVLMAELESLGAKVDITDDDGMEVTSSHNVKELITDVYDPKNLIKLRPKALNRRLKGGALRTSHILFFGRPNSGKTATVLTNIVGFLRQGLSGILVVNEDPAAAYWTRILCNILGVDEDTLLQDFDNMLARARELGIDNLLIIAMAPGTPREIEALVRKFHPKFLVVDQIHNLNMGGEGGVKDLEDAARFMRNMGIRHNLLPVSVCQAGDSAEQKQILDMNDIYGSKTGIQGALDIQIGLGVDKQLEEEGIRIMSIVKNKRSGIHENFPCRLRKEISRVYDV